VPDPAVPFAESVGTLVELQEEGKIRHIGLSNVDVDQVEEALALTPVVSIQNRYNFSDRRSEPVIDLAEERGIAFIPWAPLSRGGGGRALAGVAERHGASPVQVAIAWQLARSPQMLPIPGTGSPDHLDENVDAVAVDLTEDDLAALSTPPRPRSFSSRMVRKLRGS
jgi:pyridoxine 4-dehydrogenase